MIYIQWDPDYAFHHGTEANGLNKQDWLFEKKCGFWPVLRTISNCRFAKSELQTVVNLF